MISHAEPAAVAPRPTPSTSGGPARKIRFAVASAADRERIYELRHEVYARELGQHPENPERKLSDTLDAYNVYLTASVDGRLVGFISITPPGHASYSVDKYLPRSELPFPFDDGLYEVRILTLVDEFRGGPLAGLLMYAAFRWIEESGGTRIVAIGRLEVLEIYLKGGLRPLGRRVRSGAVEFEVLAASVGTMGEVIRAAYGPAMRKYDRRVEWDLPFPFLRDEPCIHGGASFDAIGDEFDSLERRDRVINADVLDAWFPPAPEVVAALQQHLPWLLRTSPPTGCEGMVRAIARARGVDPSSILPGGGSSDLIFLALREWLTPASRALILDPMYGEYAHVLENVVGCRVDRLTLSRGDGYVLDPGRLAQALERDYDLLVLVNPNSPTGRHVPREQLESVLAGAPRRTLCWIDETYVEFAGPEQSLERFAARSPNVVVCKSMSKVYALGGARVAYLSGPRERMRSLRKVTPPWAVSLLAQVAAVRALEEPAYYAERYRETQALREWLAAKLSGLGMEVIPSVTNFVLCHLPETAPPAALLLERSRAKGLFLRDAGTISPLLGDRAFRAAVKDAETNVRMVPILAGALAGTARS